jgi:hypothetical protein
MHEGTILINIQIFSLSLIGAQSSAVTVVYLPVI